mgnify:CR=1 FL=1
MVGAVPDRYRSASDDVDLATYFAMARGGDFRGNAVAPLEMTKWFDTNYHFIVPDLSAGQRFTYPDTKAVATELMDGVPDDLVYKLMRGNAARMLSLDTACPQQVLPDVVDGTPRRSVRMAR